MENLLVNSQFNLLFQKYKLKKCKSNQNYSDLKNAFLLNINNDKIEKISNKEFFNKKIFRKNLFPSSSNIQINNYTSNINSPIISMNRETLNNEKNKSKDYLNSSINCKKKKKKFSFNFDNNKYKMIKLRIKSQIEFKYPKKFNKSKSINYIHKEGQFFKTENNQKLIFNNVGIHYHNENNNNNEKYEIINYKEEIAKLKNKINILTTNFNNIEKEKNQKNQKIELLEEKVENLMYFIKNNNILALKEKISNLENSVDYLKLENEQLKKDINKKNKFFMSLTNSQLNKSIGKKKRKNNINNNNNKIKFKISNEIKESNILNDIDIQKIKLISIDPDNY